MYLYLVTFYTIPETWKTEEYAEKTELYIGKNDEEIKQKADSYIDSSFYDDYDIEKIEKVDGYKVKMVKE